MHEKLESFGIIFMLLSLGVITPAHAAVETLTTDKAIYSIGEKIIFKGTADADEIIFVAVDPPNSGTKIVRGGQANNDGIFELPGVDADELFSPPGTYVFTGFSEKNQTVDTGIRISLIYENNKISLIPDIALELESIGDKIVEEGSDLIFTASVTNSEFTDLEYLLDSNPPTGATINDAGQFSWTPSSVGIFSFDVVVTDGVQEDREKITITVNQKQKSTSEIKEEPPKEPAPFVDPTIDPQYYVDRYTNEPKYKDWFDSNFPDITIYEAVGLDEPDVGVCGPETQFKDGECVAIKQEPPSGGGCLIATATYGTELALQVQFLREIRDNTLLSTESGSSFMSGFNQLYYSFSPTIADWERENPMFREGVKALITPMISTLSIMTLADEGSESQVLGLGLSVIALNLGMYIAAPTLAIWQIKKRIC